MVYLSEKILIHHKKRKTVVKAMNGKPFVQHHGKEQRKGNEDGQIVYITEKGTVWHSDYQCSYLQLSIQYVQYSELKNMRNEGGGKYHKCEQCVYGQAMNGVYITSYGNRYHNSLNCSSLKRTIRAVHKSEVAGRGGCSKCAK